MLKDLLLPRTDGGVAAQFAATLVLFPAVMWWARQRDRELRIFLIGVFVLWVGVMALRTVH